MRGQVSDTQPRVRVGQYGLRQKYTGYDHDHDQSPASNNRGNGGDCMVVVVGDSAVVVGAVVVGAGWVQGVWGVGVRVALLRTSTDAVHTGWLWVVGPGT